MKENISALLKKYDMVLMIVDESGAEKDLTCYFLESEALRKTSKRLLVLSDKDISWKDTHHEYRKLIREELDAIRKLYFMYDFSDHFQVLSDNPQYGSLLNYVNTGNITLEDAFQMLLM